MLVLYFLSFVGVEMDILVFQKADKKAVILAIAGMVLHLRPWNWTLLLQDKVFENNMTQAISFSLMLLSLLLHFLFLLGSLLRSNSSTLFRVGWLFCLCSSKMCIALLKNDTISIASLWVLLSSAAFVAFCVYAVRPAASWVVKKPEGESFSEFYLSFILAGVMVSGFFTVVVVTHSVLGAFVFGLAIPA